MDADRILPEPSRDGGRACGSSAGACTGGANPEAERSVRGPSRAGVSGLGLAVAVSVGVIGGRWVSDGLFAAGSVGSGWGVSPGMGAAIAGAPAGFDTAWTADMAAATLEAGGEEVLVLLDARTEKLSCYRVANQRLVEHMGGEDLGELFRLGAAVGAGR